MISVTYLNKAIMKMKPDKAGPYSGIGGRSLKDDLKHNIE